MVPVAIALDRQSSLAVSDKHIDPIRSNLILRQNVVAAVDQSGLNGDLKRGLCTFASSFF
jgi:hypothetical protein